MVQTKLNELRNMDSDMIEKYIASHGLVRVFATEFITQELTKYRTASNDDDYAVVCQFMLNFFDKDNGELAHLKKFVDGYYQPSWPPLAPIRNEVEDRLTDLKSKCHDDDESSLGSSVDETEEMEAVIQSALALWRRDKFINDISNQEAMMRRELEREPMAAVRDSIRTSFMKFFGNRLKRYVSESGDSELEYLGDFFVKFFNTRSILSDLH